MLDTVGWVILPVKIVPDMTYNVFGGTLNPTLLLLHLHVTTAQVVNIHVSLVSCFLMFQLNEFLVFFSDIVDLIYRYHSQVIGWKDSLRNDLLCVEWDVKLYSRIRSLNVYYYQFS